ncbi:MAG: imidazoleglycerol-phosphate dehydratase HisB [Methanoregulaceae archaeon]|nr:imidazoleglycerol-phosphate dehydratase HisB [Methanoregulaceae archaeon]
MRKGTVSRRTRETQISAVLDLDGSGECTIDTGVPFFDHMLHAMARHGGFDLSIRAEGDLGVDVHHTVEDTGIVLGTAIKEAIGDGRGIRRFAHAIVPMDEARAMVAIDCGGRPYLVYSGDFSGRKVGNVEVELLEHFFHSLCTNAGITAHILFEGRNDHHRAEAVFKAFGIALSGAVEVREGDRDIPSTKGTFR